MGTLWNRSGTVERYADDLRASGAKAYFYLGGTTTPLTVFEDSAEGAAHTHPLVADSVGRWPNVFIPYIQSYDVRVTSSFDEQLTFTQQIPNPDPVELSVTIAPEEKVQTGMIHCELINGTRASYVRLNGRTIGNAASGGTERANADTGPLFTYLWNSMPDTVAPVSGGRGASASADFAANKVLTLPNWQGADPVGLDDMGSTAGGFFSGLTFISGNATTAGSIVGTNTITLVEANLPAHSHTGTTAAEGLHTHSGTTSAGSAHSHGVGTFSADSSGSHQHSAFINDPTHTHTYERNSGFGSGGGTQFGGVQTLAAVTSASATGVRVKSTSGGAADDLTASAGLHVHTISGTSASESTHTHTFTSGAGSPHSHTFTTGTTGSGTAHANLPRSVLVTWFIKL